MLNVFKLIDKDNSGFLDAEEVREGMEKLGSPISTFLVWEFDPHFLPLMMGMKIRLEVALVDK